MSPAVPQLPWLPHLPSTTHPSQSRMSDQMIHHFPLGYWKKVPQFGTPDLNLTTLTLMHR